MTTYSCDVLIVGGGILGAWVLDRLLEAGYQSPILLETELLGCRQTGHSDAFLHQGYAYFRKAGAGLLIDAWNAWQPWLPPAVSPATMPPAYHVFFDPAQRQKSVVWRQSPNLPAPPAQHNFNAQCPDIGVTHYAIETDERCAPGNWIVDRLVDGRRAHLQKVRQIARITLAHDPAVGRLRLRSVEVVMNDNSNASFEPKALLLCAGRANQALLHPNNFVVPAGHSLPPDIAGAKQVTADVSLDMIVASGPRAVLPVFNGSVSGGTVQDDMTGQSWNVYAFVVTREDLEDRRVWIASGRVYRTDPASPQGLLHSTGPMFRRLLIEFLSDLFSFKNDLTQLVWGVYPAVLTTWLRKPDDLSSQTFENMGIEGLLVCYTDRLTITPLAADEIEQEVSLKLRPNWSLRGVSMPRLPPQPVALHPEYWRTPARWERQTSWPWAEFQAQCL